MNGMFNLTWNQIITIDPISISNLIASVALALIVVYVTMWLNQKKDFKSSRNGLITEINRNWINCENLDKNLEEVIKDYSQYTKDGKIPLIIGFLQDYSAYNYFTQQGYFIKISRELRIKIENYYLSSKLLLELYNLDRQTQENLKNIEPARRVVFENLRLNQNLTLLKSKLIHQKDLFDDLIKEMIKAKWLHVE
jgi:hypothetical protein